MGEWGVKGEGMVLFPATHFLIRATHGALGQRISLQTPVAEGSASGGLMQHPRAVHRLAMCRPQHMRGSLSGHDHHPWPWKWRIPCGP